MERTGSLTSVGSGRGSEAGWGLKGPVATSNSSGSCVWNWGFELPVGPEVWEVSTATTGVKSAMSS